MQICRPITNQWVRMFNHFDRERLQSRWTKSMQQLRTLRKEQWAVVPQGDHWEAQPRTCADRCVWLWGIPGNLQHMRGFCWDQLMCSSESPINQWVYPPHSLPSAFPLNLGYRRTRARSKPSSTGYLQVTRFWHLLVSEKIPYNDVT